MVSMDLPTAVKSYQFGERAKSELIIASQLCMALSGFSGQERAGGRRMLLMLMESVRSELQFAHNSTNQQASEKIAAAISASTTSAQQAWQVLAEHGLL